MGKGTRGFAGLCRTQLRTGALCRQGLSAAQTLPGEPQGERWERRGAEEAGPLSTASKPTALQWDPDARLSLRLVAWVSLTPLPALSLLGPGGEGLIPGPTLFPWPGSLSTHEQNLHSKPSPPSRERVSALLRVAVVSGRVWA